MTSGPDNPPAPLSSIDILIPAHNEAEQIGATLASLQHAIEHLKTNPSLQPLPRISIQVGADHCTDQTSPVARQFDRVSVTEFREKGSKWTTIKALLARSTADWVILVDAGTVWPKAFLVEFLQRAAGDPDAMAIAPAYRPLKAGWLPQMVWKIETSLKRIEAFCGGPVSLHGATVAYKSVPLKKALAHLGSTLWLNDDVVIPLILRALHPKGVILYPVGQVEDSGAKNDKLDIGRRKRILLGNLQWVKALLPDCFKRNPVVGMVAARRLFRILWAYWLAFIALAMALTFHVLVLPSVIALGTLMAISGSFRQFAGAALVSFQAPFRLAFSEGVSEGTWK